MCHDQKLDYIPILEDGHQFVNIPITRIPTMRWMTTNHLLCFDPGTFKQSLNTYILFNHMRISGAVKTASLRWNSILKKSIRTTHALALFRKLRTSSCFCRHESIRMKRQLYLATRTVPNRSKTCSRKLVQFQQSTVSKLSLLSRKEGARVSGKLE